MSGCSQFGYYGEAYNHQDHVADAQQNAPLFGNCPLLEGVSSKEVVGGQVLYSVYERAGVV